MLEFDANGTLEKTGLIHYFQKVFKLLIKAEMEIQVNKYEHWEELVKKTVIAKAKEALRPVSYIREMNQYYPRGNRPTYTTTAKSQRSPMKNFCSEDHNSRSSSLGMGSGLGSQCTNTESSTKSKKQKYSLNKKSGTFASGTNMIKAGTNQKLKK